MPGDDIYGGASSSRFLSPGAPSPRKSPSKQSLSISRHRSTASLRGAAGLGQTLDDEGANGRHSLAHELAVALLPEPSAGSKLLAEEFGIEYDEGAEGIDGEMHEQGMHPDDGPTFAEELNPGAFDASPEPGTPTFVPPDLDPTFGSPAPSTRQKKAPEQDAMVVLSQDLESTEKFLTHLRRLDTDASAPGSTQASLEKIASDVIRKLNDTVRDREGQVRELLEYEREFRKIAGEVGGNDALAGLDELEEMDDLVDQPSAGLANGDSSRMDSRRALETLAEEPSFATSSSSHDWEVDPDQHLRDEDDPYESDVSPVKDSFSLPPPPPVNGPMTPAKTIPQLAHLRTYTSSLVSSLTVISEHAQVNGAATTEAGRKIRALKNKLGGWRTDWDSAERSRIKIEQWESGEGARRIDGRKTVEEHLRAFEHALAEANTKTQAIMAAS